MEPHVITKEDWLEAVNKGWHCIVGPLIDECWALDGRILQIKEKFGGLRFYYQLPESNPEFDAKVDAAEVEADHTCEFCGAEGRVRNLGGRGWIKCACDVCDGQLSKGFA